MDRNFLSALPGKAVTTSLSARRAWIEIWPGRIWSTAFASLSARRAWIEILISLVKFVCFAVALRKESVDRNDAECLRR